MSSRRAWLALTALALGGAAAAVPAVAEAVQVVMREQIVVRVGRRELAHPPAIHWKEGRGPKCVQARAIAGASMLGKNSVDLVMRDRSRVRARLEKACPALDFYYGFYISPNPDGRICADRDAVRSRMGGKCEIERFRALTAERKQR